MDLGSTHGTFVNKQRIGANTFIRLQLGDCVRFGESTRLFVLAGPEDLRAPDLPTASTERSASGRGGGKLVPKQQQLSREAMKKLASAAAGTIFFFYSIKF